LISPLSVPEERKAKTHVVETVVVLSSVQRGTILVGLFRWGSWLGESDVVKLRCLECTLQLLNRLVGSTGQCAAALALPIPSSRDLSVRRGLKTSKDTEFQPSGMCSPSARFEKSLKTCWKI